ncbi:MAG: hypothetical protein H6581_24305 [Bacteroidia bacterium]|nr:hypothetical protein [Bacteroidia bacterium]
MMNKFNLWLILILIGASCNGPELAVNCIKEDACNSLVSLFPSPEIQDSVTFAGFQQNWSGLSGQEKCLIPWLLTFEGNREFSVPCSDDASQIRLGTVVKAFSRVHSTSPLPNEVYALYLIHALHRNNYFFARDKMVIDRTLDKISPEGSGEMHPAWFLQNPTILKEAWLLTRNWWAKVNNQPWEEIKGSGGPFSGTSLLWVGELEPPDEKEFYESLGKGLEWE